MSCPRPDRPPGGGQSRSRTPGVRGRRPCVPPANGCWPATIALVRYSQLSDTIFRAIPVRQRLSIPPSNVLGPTDLRRRRPRSTWAPSASSPVGPTVGVRAGDLSPAELQPGRRRLDAGATFVTAGVGSPCSATAGQLDPGRQAPSKERPRRPRLAGGPLLRSRPGARGRESMSVQPEWGSEKYRRRVRIVASAAVVQEVGGSGGGGADYADRATPPPPPPRPRRSRSGGQPQPQVHAQPITPAKTSP